MIRTTCPQCGREDAIADYLATLPVLCKQCGHRVTMGEVLAPTKPPPPPVAKAPPPPPPAPNLQPQPKPDLAPVLVAAPEAEPPDSEPLIHANGAVISPRPAIVNATGPGVVDLFEDAGLTERRFVRTPAQPPSPLPTAPVGVSFHRGRRLAARLITLVGAVVALAAGILLVGFAPGVVKNDRLMSAVFLLVPLGLYAMYNVVLLGTQGQDFGKRALKLRIVGDDGTPARFARAFLKRELVVILLLAGLIPLAWRLYKLNEYGQLAGLWQRSGWQMFLPNRMPEVMPALAAVLFSALNAVMIFNKDGKCIHDRLAKTRVERDGEPPTPVPPAPILPPRPPMPTPTIPRPPSVPSVAFIQQPPAPVPDPPRRGSLADYVAQATKELPTTTDVKKAKLDDAEPPRDIPFFMPASRWVRLGARLLDGVIASVFQIVGVVLVTFAPPAVKQTPLLMLALFYTPGMIFWVINLYLIAKHGQHVGKRILGIRIVRDDGSRVGIWRGFIRREFAYYAIVTCVATLGALGAVFAPQPIASLSMLLYFVALVAAVANYLAIFRDSEQCLHDQLAGTIVVYDTQNR